MVHHCLFCYILERKDMKAAKSIPVLYRKKKPSFFHIHNNYLESGNCRAKKGNTARILTILCDPLVHPNFWLSNLLI